MRPARIGCASPSICRITPRPCRSVGWMPRLAASSGRRAEIRAAPVDPQQGDECRVDDRVHDRPDEGDGGRDTCTPGDSWATTKNDTIWRSTTRRPIAISDHGATIASRTSRTSALNSATKDRQRCSADRRDLDARDDRRRHRERDGRDDERQDPALDQRGRAAAPSRAGEPGSRRHPADRASHPSLPSRHRRGVHAFVNGDRWSVRGPPAGPVRPIGHRSRQSGRSSVSGSANPNSEPPPSRGWA